MTTFLEIVTRSADMTNIFTARSVKQMATDLAAVETAPDSDLSTLAFRIVETITNLAKDPAPKKLVWAIARNHIGNPHFESELRAALTAIRDGLDLPAMPEPAPKPKSSLAKSGCRGQLWEECPVCGTEPVCARCGYCAAHGKCGGAPPSSVSGELYGGTR